MKYDTPMGALPYVFDLEPGREVRLCIPLHLTQSEADRICRLINTLVEPSKLPEGR